MVVFCGVYSVYKAFFGGEVLDKIKVQYAGLDAVFAGKVFLLGVDFKVSDAVGF